MVAEQAGAQMNLQLSVAPRPGEDDEVIEDGSPDPSRTGGGLAPRRPSSRRERRAEPGRLHDRGSGRGVGGRIRAALRVELSVPAHVALGVSARSPPVAGRVGCANAISLQIAERSRTWTEFVHDTSAYSPNRLCAPHAGLGARSTPAAVTSRARSSSSASASSSCPSCLAPHPSSAASVTPAPSFLGWPYFSAYAFAFGRRLPLAQQGELPADTDRQAQPARARSHRVPGRRRRL